VTRRRAKAADQRQRDHDLEKQWVYADRVPGLSTLAFISDRQDQLAREFWKYRSTQPADRRFRELLDEWVERRFGAPLDRAARGVLEYAIRESDPAGAPEGWPRSEGKPKPKEGWLPYKD
jgi:hypothetical protein